MTNRKNTRRALVLSLLSLLLCCSMLVGTTFAWFTDSVTSGNNKIIAGNLDIELDYSMDLENWNDVTAAGDIFVAPTGATKGLWEPGHTEVAYLRVTNAGTLALKYRLQVNPFTETTGTSVNGDEIKLSEILKFVATEPSATALTAYTRETAQTAAMASTGTKLTEYTVDEIEMMPGDVQYIALVVYMPEEVGNEANYRGTTIPTIEFALNLFATQLTAENDSFDDQYDANAPFSVWDGVVPAEMPASLVVDGDTQTVHVQDAAAFAYLSTLSARWAELYTDGNGTGWGNYVNGAGGNYYGSGNWSVSLEADIDLNNHPIEPVSILFGESTGFTAFDGNGHTIRNISTTTGLFADRSRASYSNLGLLNVKATKGALTGVSDASITNVTVKNATISGVDYIGGLAGRVFGNVSGCKVIDSSVTATGKEAGGLIGYAETNSTTISIKNNTVKNVSVYANNRAAGLVAQPNVNIMVYGNTIDTVTVGAEDLTQYAPGAVVSNALAPENVYDNTVINATILGDFAMVASADDLRAFAANSGENAAVALNASITLGDDTTQKGMGAYFPNAKNVTIFGNGHTLTLKGVMPGNDWPAQYYAGIIAPDATVTVKDLTIVNEKLDKTESNMSADRKSVYTMVRGTSVLFENVDFVGGVQVVNNTKFVGCDFQEDVLVTNAEGYATNGKFCVFIDFEYNASAVCTVDFEGCTFDAKGYGCVKAAGDKGASITVNVKDCSFANTCPSNSWSQDTPKYDVKATGVNVIVYDLGGNTWAKGLK